MRSTRVICWAVVLREGCGGNESGRVAELPRSGVESAGGSVVDMMLRRGHALCQGTCFDELRAKCQPGDIRRLGSGLKLQSSTDSKRAVEGVDHCGDGRCAPMNATYVTLRHRKCALVAESSLFVASGLSNKYRCSLPLSSFSYTTRLSTNFNLPSSHINTFTMAARSRLPLIAGLGAATFGGYYMYRAGGSPKVAEKQIERTYIISSSFDHVADFLQTMLPACRHQQRTSCPAAPRSSRPRQRSTASRLARRLTTP